MDEQKKKVQELIDQLKTHANSLCEVCALVGGHCGCGNSGHWVYLAQHRELQSLVGLKEAAQLAQLHRLP